MRSLLSVLLISFCTVNLFSQTADKGRIKVNLGTGFGVLQTISNSDINSTGFAVPSINYLEFEYNTHKQVSFGLELFSHTYNAEDTAVTSIGGGALGFDLKYYLTNKEKSNLFIGVTVGGANLVYQAYHYPDSGSIDSTRKNIWFQAAGAYNKVYMGFNKYFGNVFGLSIKAGFMNMTYRLRDVTIDDVEVERFDRMPVSSWNTLLRGGFVNIGFTLKFRNKTGNKEVVVDESTG